MNEEEIKKWQQRKEELQEKLSNPDILRDYEKVKNLSIEFSAVQKKLELFSSLHTVTRRIKETKEMLGDENEEMRKTAKKELHALEQEKNNIEENLAGKNSEELPQNVIIEIRAGAGGDEASLFAKELFQMYGRFAQKKGWETVALDESKSDIKGYKEVVFEINGSGAYDTLRFESGVHRIQRIPETEKMGRIHTSTASVAVLPKAREIDVEIRPQDIKIEFYRASGPGGQNVNKVETAVRITHLPSGTVVQSQDSRSQQKNREHAMNILRSKILDVKIQEEAKKIAAERKQQIGTGDRSEKIRTYNFPQDRVTDHRIKESWHNIPSIMEGNIEPIVEKLKTENERLKMSERGIA